MRPFATLLHTVLLLSTVPALAAPPAEERIRVANQVPFDVAACGQEVTTLSGEPSATMLASALVLAQPRALECLTKAEARGKAPTTTVKVVLKLSDQGAVFTASGDNLTPSGAACVTGVLKEAITFEPLAAGAAPIELGGELVHDVTLQPSLETGINPPSDWIAMARGSLPSWCSCYAPFASRRPLGLVADVRLAAGKSEVAFRKAGDAEGETLGQCLLPHLAALPVPKSDKEFRFALKLIHMHSADLAAATDLVPEHAFQHADLGRLRLFATAELALAKRARTAARYDAAVVAYQKAPKMKEFPALVRQCAGLVDADTAWLTAAQTLLAHEDRMMTSTRALADKDPSWKTAADTMIASRTATEKEVTTATQTLAADKQACPKIK